MEGAREGYADNNGFPKQANFRNIIACAFCSNYFPCACAKFSIGVSSLLSSPMTFLTSASQSLKDIQDLLYLQLEHNQSESFPKKFSDPPKVTNVY